MLDYSKKVNSAVSRIHDPNSMPKAYKAEQALLI